MDKDPEKSEKEVNLSETCDCTLDIEKQTITCTTSDLNTYQKLTKSQPKKIEFQLTTD